MNCSHRLQAIKEVFIPALNSRMSKGKIVSWLKKEGEKVSKGEAIAVIETDNADIEVKLFEQGYLGSIVVKKGEIVPVGVPIAFIAESKEEIEQAKKRAFSNNYINDKNALEEAFNESKTVQSDIYSNTETDIHEHISKLTNPDTNAIESVSTMSKIESPIEVGHDKDKHIISTPSAKKLARDMSIDISKVPGSGIYGRITVSDVQKYAYEQERLSDIIIEKSSIAMVAVKPEESTTTHMISEKGEMSEISKLNGKTILFDENDLYLIKYLMYNLKVPRINICYEMITDKFEKLCVKIKPKGVTMTAMIAKACAIAITKHPIMNACFTPGYTGITFNENVAIAIIVKMENGRTSVPFIKDCDTKDIYAISREWSDLCERGRQNKLALDEKFQPGMFWISNLGMYGTDEFDTIIPEGSSVLTVGTNKPTIVVSKDSQMEIKKSMKLTLCCDNRILNIFQAAEYMETLKEIIENPEYIIMS